MVDVNRTRFNEIPQQWAFDPEIGPFIESLLTEIFQLRSRGGGDTDTVASHDTTLTSHDSTLSSHTTSIGSLQTDLDSAEVTLAELENVQTQITQLKITIAMGLQHLQNLGTKPLL